MDWARESSISEEELKRITDTTNPKKFFTYFSKNKTVYLIYDDKTTHEDELICHNISFPSPFESKIEVNNTVHAALYSHTKPTSLIIILIGTFHSSFNPFEHWMAKTIAKKGVDCCVIELPYAQKRSPTTWSGYIFITEDPVSTAESLIQTIIDVDHLYEILYNKYKYKHIGLVGISTGGNAAHACTFLKPYEGAVLIISGASPASIVWQGKGPFWSSLRQKMSSSYSFKDIETLWTMSDTTKYSCSNLCKKFLMMNALFDTLVTPRHALHLNKAIPDCPIVWYPGGHYNAFVFVKPAIENIIRFYNEEPIIDTKIKPNL